MVEKAMLPETACRLCFPDAVDYGELIPGHFLVENNGEWFLVDANGHNKLFVFDGEPSRDPDTDKSDDEINNLTEEEKKEWDAWQDRCMRSHPVTTSPDENALTETAMALGVAMHKYGWHNPDQRVEISWNVESQQGGMFWLYEVAGNLIALRRNGSC